MKVLDVNCNNQLLILHPSGAIFWQEQSILLIADVHLGKIAHFRKHGSAIPHESIYQNFEQLTDVVAYFKPKTLCFLGDLFHSHINNEWLLFAEWVSQNKCEVVLVSGNHDIIPNLMFNEISITVKSEWVLDGFLLTHYPEIRKGCFNFSGHIHPGVKLKGVGRQTLRVSCFYKNENQMVLPAFGNFTGKHVIQPKGKDKIFVNTTDEVIEVSAKSLY